MTVSAITVSGLVASPGIGLVSLQWSVSDPQANGLPYLSLDAVEVWAAITNSRGSASKVAEGRTSALHVAIPLGATYYYWIRARDRNTVPLYSAWFPSDASAGIQGNGLQASPAVGAHTLTVSFTCDSFGVGYFGGIQIYYGDGSYDAVVVGTGAASAVAKSHNYTAAGSYIATLIGTGEGGRYVLGLAVINVQ